MDIPILTNFIDGLKLFFASKKLKWLTLIFFIGAFTITIWENLVLMFPWVPALGFIALWVGGLFPTFFLISCFLSLIGFARFIADDESYRKSFIFTMIWFVVSFFVLIMLFFIRPIFNWLYIGVAFLGWIGFQSYFSTRTALGYAESVDISHQSKIVGFLYGFIYILNYVVIVGAVVVTFVFVNPSWGAGLLFGIIGALLACLFNFVNGLILVAERNKSTASNISFLGLFISFYSAYFIYNVMKGYDPGLDIVGIGISVFFILYTMSSVGRSLASRAELDTRWKLNKELAATFTFFLASGFMFVDAMFSVILGLADASLEGGIGDVVKLIVFPFLAFIMALNFVRKSRKEPKVPHVYDDIPIVPEEEPMVESEEPAVEPEEAMVEEEPEIIEDTEDEEASVPEDSESDEEESDDDSDSWDE
ncbi:MAG: hypothetical protein E4H14_13645 [Candidatus Thorarchaeota archaeon]|nr:MAG: hypothetical protein E4H14_13645 [Candidatus Thorarchaeota archaeon]